MRKIDPLGESVVIIVDTSLSMRERDFKPNRLEVEKRVTKRLAISLLERDRPTLVGIVGFYRWGYPLLSLTSDVNEVLQVIDEIQIMGEASAPGDALEKAINMLLVLSPPGFSRRIILITDGTFNEGVPPDIIARYAQRVGIIIDVLSFGKLTRYDREVIERIVRYSGGEWLHAQDEQAVSYPHLTLPTN